MKRQSLLLIAFAMACINSQSQAFIPAEFQGSIRIAENASHAAAAITAQCLHILRHFGEAGIAIVQRIIQQVPEIAGQVRDTLRSYGYNV